MRVTFFSLLTLLLAAASGCPGDTGGVRSLCTPGATQGCVCVSGQQSAQVCGQDGNSWSPCQCGSGGLDQGYYYSPDGGVVPPPGDQGTSLSTGSGTCTEIFTCFYTSQCQENDNACFDACVAKGSQVAQQQASAVAQCENNAMQSTCTQCNSDQPTESCSSCLDQACAQPYQACGFVFSCAQAYQCLGQCGQNDNACYDGCLGKLTLVGAFRYDKMMTCFDNAYKGTCQGQCGDPNSQGCYNCIDQACLGEIQTCGLTS